METMQLQPTRTNLIYLNRNKAGNPRIQTVEPIEIINIGIVPTNPVKAEPISTGEGNELPFIEANTKEVTMQYLKEECITPVFSKDNEVTISHSSFIETVWDAANKVFSDERIEEPAIRVSHVIKGRIPEAVYKLVDQLLESDKTIYFERMMFCFEIPTIYEDVAGNRLDLTIGGARVYNHENLYDKKGTEKFKVFIGFKNLVCCNMCISTDGYRSELKVMNTIELLNAVMKLFQEYNIAQHLYYMSAYEDTYMRESQFAQFLDRCRLHQFLPIDQKKKLPQVLMTDTRIGLVAKAYYNDDSFSTLLGSREISMWNVYDLLTGANKSSYIDSFLDRSPNVTQLAEGLNKALYGENEYSWLIS